MTLAFAGVSAFLAGFALGLAFVVSLAFAAMGSCRACKCHQGHHRDQFLHLYTFLGCESTGLSRTPQGVFPVEGDCKRETIRPTQPSRVDFQADTNRSISLDGVPMSLNYNIMQLSQRKCTRLKIGPRPGLVVAWSNLLQAVQAAYESLARGYITGTTTSLRRSPAACRSYPCSALPSISMSVH